MYIMGEGYKPMNTTKIEPPLILMIPQYMLILPTISWTLPVWVESDYSDTYVVEVISYCFLTILPSSVVV